ncbi:MAG: metallophosphoesterase [Campylobacterota bacterium]
MKLLFPLIILTFFAFVHYLFYARVIKKLHFKTKTQKILLGVVIFNALGVASYIISRYFSDFPSILYFFASLSIGVGFVFFTFWIIYEFLHLLQRHAPVNKKRREFFKKSSDIGFVSAGTLYVGTAAYEGSKMPSIKFVKHDQKLFSQTLRVVQISDMHIGGLIEEDFVKQSVAMINSLNPDIVVLTGDMIDVKVREVATAVDHFANIQAKHGVYYITGNHEFFHGIEDIMHYIQALGITVLANSSETVSFGDNKLNIIGVHDIFGYRYGSLQPDLKAATQNIDPASPTLLLAHQPRFVHYLEDFKPNLMLSGHTHGGQLWPFNFLVKLQQPYLKGLYKMQEDSYIYVNTGIGFWGPPMRLGTSAEITCIDWS